jgi:3-deoxy-D-manno-octulosonate 8-phosphate phosphatase KdsC-like HAD superfamily phosphatase
VCGRDAGILSWVEGELVMSAVGWGVLVKSAVGYSLVLTRGRDKTQVCVVGLDFIDIRARALVGIGFRVSKSGGQQRSLDTHPTRCYVVAALMDPIRSCRAADK